MLRGIRGATTVDNNDSSEIRESVAQLLKDLVLYNDISIEDIGAVIFSSTADLNSAFPALGARDIGWSEVPLFGTLEIENPQGVEKCIRVLILWNTNKSQKEIKHIYLKNSASLRPDIIRG